MFNPAAREQAKARLAEKRRIAAKVRNKSLFRFPSCRVEPSIFFLYIQIKEWVGPLIPVELQQGLQLDVKEVECGDPVGMSCRDIISQRRYNPYCIYGSTCISNL